MSPGYPNLSDVTGVTGHQSATDGGGRKSLSTCAAGFPALGGDHGYTIAMGRLAPQKRVAHAQPIPPAGTQAPAVPNRTAVDRGQLGGPRVCRGFGDHHAADIDAHHQFKLARAHLRRVHDRPGRQEARLQTVAALYLVAGCRLALALIVHAIV